MNSKILYIIAMLLFGSIGIFIVFYGNTENERANHRCFKLY